MSQVPFPSRTATVGSFLAVSGGGTSNIFSGQGVVLGVLAYPLSGSAFTASFSGAMQLLVQDATSGMVTMGSGANVIYRYEFGNQSGFGASAPQVFQTNIQYCEVFCNSGLVAVTASGWGLTVIYNK